MARVYATEADLMTWTGNPAPENAVSLLRAASSLVEDAALLAYYPTDRAGLPTHPAHVTAFMEATCQQTAYWVANGLDPAAGELSEQDKKIASSKSIKGASISYDSADAAATKQARMLALLTLATSSFVILRNAGLITAVVR